MEPEPQDYIAKCRAALNVLNDAIDWSKLQDAEQALAESDDEYEV